MAPKGSDLQSVSAYQKGQLVLLCAGKQRHCKGAAGGGAAHLLSSYWLLLLRSRSSSSSSPLENSILCYRQRFCNLLLELLNCHLALKTQSPHGD